MRSWQWVVWVALAAGCGRETLVPVQVEARAQPFTPEEVGVAPAEQAEQAEPVVPPAPELPARSQYGVQCELTEENGLGATVLDQRASFMVPAPGDVGTGRVESHAYLDGVLSLHSTAPLQTRSTDLGNGKWEVVLAGMVETAQGQLPLALTFQIAAEQILPRLSGVWSGPRVEWGEEGYLRSGYAMGGSRFSMVLSASNQASFAPGRQWRCTELMMFGALTEQPLFAKLTEAVIKHGRAVDGTLVAPGLQLSCPPGYGQTELCNVFVMRHWQSPTPGFRFTHPDEVRRFHAFLGEFDSNPDARRLDLPISRWWLSQEPAATVKVQCALGPKPACEVSYPGVYY